MATIRDELRSVRSMVGDRRRSISRRAAERREHDAQVYRSWKNWFGDPVRMALDVLPDHEQRFDETRCSCRQVKEGHTYAEHLIHVLHDAEMLQVPPRSTGEGW